MSRKFLNQKEFLKLKRADGWAAYCKVVNLRNYAVRKATMDKKDFDFEKFLSSKFEEDVKRKFELKEFEYLNKISKLEQDIETLKGRLGELPPINQVLFDSQAYPILPNPLKIN